MLASRCARRSGRLLGHRYLSEAVISHPESRTNPPASVRAHLEGRDRYLLQVFDRPPIVFEKGHGMHIWDSEGRKYLDFSAGIAVNALGHSDEGVAEVLKTQASTLMHASNIYHTPWSGKLAERLVRLTKENGGLGFAAESGKNNGENVDIQVFFSNSGTEANEGALKIAKKVGKERWAMKHKGRNWDATQDGECSKSGIVCFENGFHGRSMGSLSVTWNTKYQGPFQPLIPGVRVGRLNDMDSLDLVNEDTCAVIIEPIQGEGGVHTANEMFLRDLRKRCESMGAVLIYDEIQSGLFRTGEMWAHGGLPVDCHPDMITVAKALGNGFPIGAVLMREEVGRVMGFGSHGTTFGGSALACAVGDYVVGRLSSLDVKTAAEYLDNKLKELARDYPGRVHGLRGRGLIRGIVVDNPGEIMSRCREQGVLVLSAGIDAVRLLPSLTVTREDIDVAMAAIANSIRP